MGVARRLTAGSTQPLGRGERLAEERRPWLAAMLDERRQRLRRIERVVQAQRQHRLHRSR